MVCPNCGKETKGLKLNGKLFCNYCGEVIKSAAEILEESYVHSADKPGSESSAKAKLISPRDGKSSPMLDDQNTGASTPNIETPTRTTGKKLKVTKHQKIKKHGRARADHRFELVDKEPDPLNKPELEAPHDMLVTQTVDTEKSQKPSYSLLTRDERKSIAEKKRRKQEIFTNYLKQTATSSSAKKQKPTKKKAQGTKPIRRALRGGAIALLVLALTGLVLYVNNVAVREDRIIQRIEATPTFAFQKPATPPLGYRLSYLSDADDNFILYHYVFNGNRERYVSLKVEKTELKDSEVVGKLLTEPGIGFEQLQYGDLVFWQTEQKQIFVIKEGLLYSFEQSGEMHSSDLLDFAKETLI